MSDCIFCKIRDKEIPSTVVYEDDDCLAFEDLNPTAPVHTLLIPKKHIENLFHIREEDPELLGALLKGAAETARIKGLSQSGFRLVANNGSGAGQEVMHMHFHILGGKKLSWPAG